MEEIDVLIIGAGVVGLAVASEIAERDKSIIVLEKNNAFGQETSSRNSEVIHAGMYYPTGTLKAKLCVEGRHLLYEICRKNNVPHRKIGKLIVATEKDETPDLDKLFQQGKNNGVEGLRIINRQEIKEMEPNISGITALYSSETGIIDSHRLMQYFFDSAKDKGAMVSFNSEVTSIEKAARGYEVLVRNGNEALTLRTRVVINCAGLDSDEIAKIAGVDTKKNKYNLKYCKGQYFRVDSNKSRLVDRLIYPVPKPKSGGLGIHSTLDLAGSMRLGPDDFYQKDRSKDYSVDKSKKYEFYNSAKKFLPFIEEDNLTEDTSGIRPKLQGEGEDFRDFVIKDELESGLAGFINLIGIESPGLTAAPAIARYVNKLARKYLNG